MAMAGRRIAAVAPVGQDQLEGIALPQRKRAPPFWQRFNIDRLEALGNAVLGAELEVVQMVGPPAHGSLAFAARDGMIFSSGLIEGRVSVRGLLPRDALTLGVGLRFGPGSRLWLNAAADGAVGVFLPGAACDVLFAGKSLYFAVSLSRERLEKEATRENLMLDQNAIGRTGLQPRPIAPAVLACLRSGVVRLHRHPPAVDDGIGRALLRAVIGHLARSPAEGNGRVDPIGHGRIVHRALEFIRASLDRPLSIDAIASVAGTSPRTLARAFFEVLDETPANHVRRLRLHRIRHDLAHAAASGRKIHEIAAASGIGNPGRMAGWYRDLFGEYPRDTLAGHLDRRRHEAPL